MKKKNTFQFTLRFKGKKPIAVPLSFETLALTTKTAVEMEITKNNFIKLIIADYVHFLGFYIKGKPLYMCMIDAISNKKISKPRFINEAIGHYFKDKK